MPPRKRRRRAKPTAQTLIDDATKAAKKQTDLESWTTRVARAREIRKDWERTQEVETGERMYLGQQNDFDGVKASLVVNRFAPTVKTIRPNLLFANPKFFVRPKPGRQAPVSENRAKVAEGVLEAISTQDDNLETAGGLALTQAFFRIGVLKTCYDPRMEKNPQAGQPIQVTDQGEPVLDEVGEPILVKDPMTGELVREPAEVITDEVYRWLWVDAANMLLPDEGPDPTKWTWIGEEVVVPLEDAKEDSRFPEALRAKLIANETQRKLRPTAQTTRDTGRTSGEEFLRYCEIYAIRQKRWMIWAEGQDFEGFLVDEVIPHWIDNDPYSLLILGEPILGPDPSPWPVPVVRDWIHPQMEYNIRRKQGMEAAKRGARKIGFTDAAFPNEEEARKALQSPNDLEAFKANDLTPSAIRVLEVPPANVDIWKDLLALDNDWVRVTGQPGVRQASPEGGTATESLQVERAASLRDSDMQKAVTRWLASAGKKMLQCVKATLTLDLWVQLREMGDKDFKMYLEKVYGIPMEAQEALSKAVPGLKEAVKQRLGDRKWLSVTREELQFEADVTVQPGSTRPRNLETERGDWFRFLEILGRAPQLAMSRALLEETAAKFGGTISETMLDELNALARQMVEVNARQAGREQGGANGAQGPGGPQSPAIAQALMAAQAGA